MKNAYFQSERLIYRPYCKDDLQMVYAYFNEASRRRWFYFQEPDCLTIEFAEKEINKNIETWSRKVDILKDDCGLAIVTKETDELIGFIGVTKFHGTEELDNIEIGYHIGEAYQGKGYATEAAKAAIQWGLAELKRIGAEAKVVAKIEHENRSSRKVAQKAGMTFTYAEKYVSVYEICG